MKSVFSKFVLAPAVLAAAALVSTSAMAESVVKVPFNFTVGNKTLPAGSYAVRHDSSKHFVTLLRKGTSDIYTWIIGPGEPSPANPRSFSPSTRLATPTCSRPFSTVRSAPRAWTRNRCARRNTNPSGLRVAARANCPA